MGIPDGASYTPFRVDLETNAVYTPFYANGENGTVADLRLGQIVVD